jgi:hypothetical protein
MVEATIRPMVSTLMLLEEIALLAAPAQAEPVRWSGNGHHYEVVVVPEGITRLGAKAAASARGGYLATLTSAEENRFVWSLIANQPSIWSTRRRSPRAVDKPDNIEQIEDEGHASADRSILPMQNTGAAPANAAGRHTPRGLARSGTVTQSHLRRRPAATTSALHRRLGHLGAATCASTTAMA